MVKWDYCRAFEQLEVGYSVFIPCLAEGAYKRAARKAADDVGIKIECRSAVRNNIKGLRIRRVM